MAAHRREIEVRLVMVGRLELEPEGRESRQPSLPTLYHLCNLWLRSDTSRGLELPSGEDRRTSRVLHEAGIADEIDVTTGQQILVVEEVENVGAELDAIGSDTEDAWSKDVLSRESRRASRDRDNGRC
jgi:hypothetical protein